MLRAKRKIFLFLFSVVLCINCDVSEEQNFSDCKLDGDLEITALDPETNKNMFTHCRYRYYSELVDPGLILFQKKFAHEFIIQLAPAGKEQVPFNQPRHNYLTLVVNPAAEEKTSNFGEYTDILPVEEMRYRLKHLEAGTVLYISRENGLGEVVHSAAPVNTHIGFITDGENSDIAMSIFFDPLEIPIENGWIFDLRVVFLLMGGIRIKNISDCKLDADLEKTAIGEKTNKNILCYEPAKFNLAYPLSVQLRHPNHPVCHPQSPLKSPV